MKRFLLGIMIIIFYPLSVYSQNEVSSIIRSVIVYPDSAIIKREARVTLKKGENVIKLTGITSFAEDNTVQAKIQKDMAKILDIRVEKSYVEKREREKEKELKHKIGKIEEDMKNLRGEESAINNYVEFLKKLSPFNTNQKLTQQEFEGYAGFINNALKAGYKRIAEIEVNLERLKEEKNNLEKELLKLQTGKEETKNIFLTVFSKIEGDVNLEFTYLVHNVKWVPGYDLRVDSVGGKITVETYAVITQDTGEDWKDVYMEVSTAKPHTGALPMITPWYVDIYRQKAPIIYKTMAMPERSKFGKESLSIEEEIMPVPQVKEGVTAFNFIMPEKKVIISNKQPHRTFLSEAKVSINEGEHAELIYQTIPRYSPFVFLTAKFKNPFNFPIIPGKMSVYIDGSFINTVDIKKMITPKEDITLTLGVDENVKVTRKLKNKYTEYAGLITKTTKVSYEYEIELVNGKSKDLLIIVKDAFPVSRNEQIKVNQISPAKGEAEIADDGIITWKVNLKGNEIKKLPLKFNIEYPADLTVEGLE